LRQYEEIYSRKDEGRGVMSSKVNVDNFKRAESDNYFRKPSKRLC
jgi:hypothetical protein